MIKPGREVQGSSKGLTNIRYQIISNHFGTGKERVGLDEEEEEEEEVRWLAVKIQSRSLIKLMTVSGWIDTTRGQFNDLGFFFRPELIINQRCYLISSI